MAAEHAPGPEVDAQKRANRLNQRLANVGASQAQRHVTATDRAGVSEYMGPASAGWDQAVEMARLVTIARAKRRDTITYGEIKWVIYDEMRALIDPAAFDALLLAMNDQPDTALLGSIAVDPDDGGPSDNFLLAAMEAGFDHPVDVLQRQVWAQFS